MVSPIENFLAYTFGSEPAVKEILLLLDAEMNFIIEDLDPNHLFIDPLQVERVQEALQARLAENVFKPNM